MKTVLGTFVGSDRSDYRTGETYKLVVHGNTIVRSDGMGFTSYRSVGDFFRNWDNLTVLDRNKLFDTT